MAVTVWRRQVPAEAVCADVPGPAVPGHRRDLQAAGRRAHLPLHDGRDAALRPARLLLPPHAARARRPRPAGAGHAGQVRPALDRDPHRHHHQGVSAPFTLQQKTQNPARCLGL